MLTNTIAVLSVSGDVWDQGRLLKALLIHLLSQFYLQGMSLSWVPTSISLNFSLFDQTLQQSFCTLAYGSSHILAV